jgi:hypothetical protein
VGAQFNDVGVSGHVKTCSPTQSVFFETTGPGVAKGPVAGCIPAPVGLVGWWPFDELAAPLAQDIAGSYQNDGTYAGAPTPVVAIVQHGLQLDGVDDCVEVPDQSELNLGTGNFSIDAWVLVRDAHGTRTILDKRHVGARDDETVTGYHLFVNDGYLCLQLADGTATNYCSDVALADGQWHHVAVTVTRGSATGIRWYLDGRPSAATDNPLSHQGSLNNSNPLLFGRNEDMIYWWSGALDEVEIFNRVLANSEVAAIFAAGSDGKCKQFSVGRDRAAAGLSDEGPPSPLAWRVRDEVVRPV